MFDKLTEALLDLTASEKGYRGAIYAANDENGSGGAACSSSTLSSSLTTCSLCFGGPEGE